ncbi:MAG: HNH endonuclease [Janthinobacterium lividum]
MIFHRSTDVPLLSDYRAYREIYLRPDFKYRCAYCLTHEFYFLQGDGGEIDHFRPLNARNQDFTHLKNDYSNLYWTCGQCNLEKGNSWPSAAEYAEGLRFLDPCIEDHDDHWNTHANGTITAKTSIGRFTVRIIRLDRQRLNDLRGFLHSYQEKITALEAELRRRDLGSDQREAMLSHLADIKQLVEPPIFER